MLIGALAGVIVLIAGAVVLLSHQSGSTPVGVNATTVAGGTTTVATDTTTTATTVPVVVPTITAPVTTAAVMGHLIVGAKSLDLGTSATTGSFQFGNDGGAPLGFAASAVGTGLTVNPGAGTLSSGATQALTVSLDRASAQPGPFTGQIILTSAAGNATIPVTAIIDPGPMITASASPLTIHNDTCKPFSKITSSTITAAVTSMEPVTLVVLHWQYTSGGTTSGTVSMTLSGTVYVATLPSTTPFSAPATIEWYVTAIDNAKATGMSLPDTLQVVC
jgi:hypothetical protein